ncbi:MAG: hypothetical protein P4M15_15095 [Alphaproteobacteria bacterium]|nr:hypothetical protein [Alphaproteobacteria bacterium]
MAKLLTLGDLQKHFEQAREKLSLDRQEILAASPLPENFNRDEYGFAYMRAERLGMEVITYSLKEIAWLPMQLDPQSEILSDNRAPMTKWLSSGGNAQPDGSMFGNDFIHALTRKALADGWESAGFRALALRVGELFHDLSCLIGLIYYGVWMSENGIEGLPVSDPKDLERTAQEIATLTRSPEVAQLLRRRKALETERAEEARPRKKGKPILRVIENTDFTPEPLGY